MVEMAKAHGIHPYNYLNYMLDSRLCPDISEAEVEELALWSETSGQNVTANHSKTLAILISDDVVGVNVLAPLILGTYIYVNPYYSVYLYCGGWIVWLDRGDFCDAEVTPLMDVPAYRARGTTADDNATQFNGTFKVEDRKLSIYT